MNNAIQMSLFDDDLPLPLIVARKWDFPLQYHFSGGVYWYSPVDWIAGLIGRASASKTWRNIEYAKQYDFSKDTLPYQATDGKTYQTDFVTDTGLYWVAQYMRNAKGREALIAIKTYLADAGAFADLARRNPGEVGQALIAVDEQKQLAKEAQKLMLREGLNRDDAYQHVKVRRASKTRRISITDSWKSRGVTTQGEFIMLSNAVMKVAIGQTATEYRRENNLPAKVSTRDYLSTADLATASFVEWASDMLSTSRDSKGPDEIHQDIIDTKPMVDRMRPEIEAALSKHRRRLPMPKGTQLSLTDGDNHNEQ